MALNIAPEKFAAFAPRAIPGTLPALLAAVERYAAQGLTEPLVMAHFFGQTRVESMAFTRLSESLNYSVDGLLATFGRHRISEADCRKYGRLPNRPADQEAIANVLYGGAWGRKNLGNTEPGDGWRYRGGGVKQITGRANYREAGHEDDPDTLRTDIRASAFAAANFFARHGCIAPARADDVEAVTRRINGGLNGLAERIAATKAAKEVVL
jgi:putative chitinase